MRSEDNPILSVILPVYNAEKYVAQAIESILNQTYVNFELIIADDGSKDGSCKIVNAYAKQDNRIIISHNEINQGKVKTVNRLFEICRGKYVTIHDADDWSDHSRFLVQIKYLEESQYVLCGTSFASVNEDGQLIESTFPEVDYEIIKTEISNKSQFHGPTVVFLKEVVSKVGGLYRYPFMVAEDIDFCERVTEKFPTTNLSKVLYYYRLHQESLTKKSALYIPDRYALRDLMIFLRDERKNTGKDSIWDNKRSVDIDAKYVNWVINWRNNLRTIYNDGIGRSLYFGFYSLAFQLSIQWIIKEPLKLAPWKNIIFVVVKCITRIPK